MKLIESYAKIMIVTLVVPTCFFCNNHPTFDVTTDYQFGIKPHWLVCILFKH